MPIRIIDRMLEDGEEVTYWPPQLDAMGRQIPDENGNITLLPPINIDAFWMDTTEQFTTGKGEERMSGAVVFVGVDLTYQGILYRKPLNRLTQAQKDDPRNNLFGWGIVQKFSKIPTPRYDQFVRKAYL